MSRKRANSPDPKPEQAAEQPPIEALAVPAGSMMGRTAAARTIGVSKTTFRRSIEGTLLPPEVGPDWVHRFREEQVRELVIQRGSKTAAPDAYNGNMAAAAFGLLDEGIHPVDIVKRLRLDPRTVEALHRQWASMRGTFVVTGEVARKIEEVPWLGGHRPIRDGQPLLENLHDSDPQYCEKCQDEIARLCAKCAKAMNAQEAEARAQQARERPDERERQRRKGQWEREYLPQHLERARAKNRDRLRRGVALGAVSLSAIRPALDVSGRWFGGHLSVRQADPPAEGSDARIIDFSRTLRVS